VEPARRGTRRATIEQLVGREWDKQQRPFLFGNQQQRPAGTPACQAAHGKKLKPDGDP